MSKKYDVCILGATGAVGEAMLAILEQRKFPVGKLYPLASSRSAGSTVTFHGEEITVLDVEGFDFSKTQIGLFSAGGSVSAIYAPIAAAAGCHVTRNVGGLPIRPRGVGHGHSGGKWKGEGGGEICQRRPCASSLDG